MVGLLGGGFAVSTPVLGSSGAGSLDPSFGSGGIAQVDDVGFLSRITVDAYDGELVAAGAYSNSPNVLAVTRYSTSGLPDWNFGSNGLAIDALGTSGGGSQANAVAVDASTGDIYAAGWESPSVGTTVPVLVRFDSSGTLSSGFDADTGTALSGYDADTATNQLNAVAVDSTNDDVIVAGTVAAGGYTSGEIFVAAFNLSTGELDDGFGSSGVFTTSLSTTSSGGDSPAALAIDPSTGEIYVDGSTPCGTSGTTAAFFLELSTTGSLVSSFNGGLGETISASSCSTNLSATDLAYTTTGNDGSTGQLVASGTLAGGTAQAEAVLFSLTASGALGAGNGFASPGYITNSALAAGSAVAFEPTSSSNADPVGIIESGAAAGVSAPGEPGLTLFSLAGASQATFGSNGTATSPSLTCPGNGVCGSGVVIQPDGDIDLSGVQSTGAEDQNDLAVAQLLNQSVALSGPGTISASQSTSATFTVQLITANASELSGSPVTVKYATSDGTARAGVNYDSESGTITFPCTNSNSEPSGVTCSDSTSATITVPIIVPSGASGSAAFTMSLSDPTNAGITSTTVSATIAYASTTASSSGGTASTGESASGTSTTTTSTAIVAGDGYWIAEADGTVLSYGDAKSYGSVTKKKLHGKITGIATASGGKGYWLVSSLGTVYAFGDAKNYGSVSKKRLHGSIEAIEPTTSYNGYFLVSSTGSVYTFGKAHNYGSVAKGRLKGIAVDLAPSAGSSGYWIASSSGTVYAFGRAKAHGSLTKRQLSGSVVALLTSAKRTGYLLVSSKGKVIAFGKAKSHGAPNPKKLAGTVTCAVSTPSGTGYWLVSTKGDVYGFGGAKVYGSAVGHVASRPVGVATT